MTLEINPEGAIFLDGWNTGAYMRKAAGKYYGISGDNIATPAALTRKCYEMHPGPAAPGVGTFAQLEADLRKIIMTPDRWPEPNAPRIASATATDVFDEIAVVTVAVALADANTTEDNDAKRAVRAAALSRAFRAGVEAAKYRALGAGYAVFVAVADGGDHTALLAEFLRGADSWGASDV